MAKKYKSAVYQRNRAAVLQRDYFTCHYCSQEANTVDHLIPLSKGGTDEMSNLVAACVSCNSGKRDRVAPGFFDAVKSPTTPIRKIFPENGSAKHYSE